MKAQTAVPYVDTNIIPDRNAGIGSLLWDLQNHQDSDRNGPLLLDREFAFIDVGVSRARVATALKSLLVHDLGMAVDYVATERLDAVPLAHVTPLGGRAEIIQGCLSRMISSQGAAREVKDWHCVVDHRGKVASLAYLYELHGNEIWEAYFMGRPFLYAGETIEFSNPELDRMLAPDVTEIEARMDRRCKRNCNWDQSAPSREGFRVEKLPLEAGLMKFGITLQKADVPQRIIGKQNVLFLGNVLNHYPQIEQARELDRVAANLEHGDLVIIQIDEVETPSIEVLQIMGQAGSWRRQRVRWINTKELEVYMPAPGSEGWRRISVKPGVKRAVSQVLESLAKEAGFPECREEARQRLIYQYFNHVFATYFRAMPVAETLRIATREALRRLPPMESQGDFRLSG